MPKKYRPMRRSKKRAAKEAKLDAKKPPAKSSPGPKKTAKPKEVSKTYKPPSQKKQPNLAASGEANVQTTQQIEQRAWSEALISIIESSVPFKRNVTPAEWNELHRYMPDDSPYPGKFSYKRTPYAREIVNRFSPYDSTKKIAFMKGAQVGASTAVLEAAIGFIIDVAPANILLLTGHADLSEEAMTERIEPMLDSAGIRHLIRPGSAASKRSGDTSSLKEFPGGKLRVGYAGNHKLMRQRSIQVMIVDDFEAAKALSKESGSTQSLIEQRQAAYYDKMKLAMISTPELKESSNIEPAFLAGDQRYWHVPCPCCGEKIPLLWEVDVDGTEKAGIAWKTDERGKLIADSVGYICQKCGGWFDDSHKYDMNLAGEWVPTAEPVEPNYVSYHLSALYAPPGMFDWEHYVREYLKAYPPGGAIDEHRAQTFTNVVLGQTYEPKGEKPSANMLMRNVRAYKVGTVPERLSEADGNGKIVLLTCAADLNGKVEDARLDYEVVAWSESGASYSITAGSIGTFVPREGGDGADRKAWTYDTGKKNSVWPEFDKVMERVFETDTGRKLSIFFAGIDAPGHFAKQAYAYIDQTNYPVCALKGKDRENYVAHEKDTAFFKLGKERSGLYLVEVNRVKDELASQMRLKWNPKNDESQPPGFMNYPQPEGGLYTYAGYFEHFESEHRVLKESGAGKKVLWVKRNSSVQNHFWDVYVYNMALRDICVALFMRELGEKPPYSWSDFADIIRGNMR